MRSARHSAATVRRPAWKLLALLGGLLLAFLVSRGFAWRSGVRSTAHLPPMHTLDSDLLRSDLGRSLFYLHSQPPLFNAALGLIFKVSDRPARGVSVAYWAVGLSLMVGMFLLMRMLGAPDVVAAVATAIYMCGPAPLLYETFNLHDYPAAALVVLLCVSSFWFLREPSARTASAVAVLLIGLAMLRSVFHLAWILMTVLLLVALVRRDRRRCALVLFVPLVVVGVLYAKNWALFDTFGSSSLLGLNLYRIATGLIPREERVRMVESGELTPFAIYRLNHPITDYPVIAGARRGVFAASGEGADLLAMGWSDAPEASRDGWFYWSVGRASVLIVPAVDGPLRLTLRCAPFEEGARSQSLSLRANGVAIGTIRLSTGIAEYSFDVPSGVLTRALNTLLFHYAHVVSPRTARIGRDPRELAVRWYDIRFSPPVEVRPYGSSSVVEPGAAIAALDRIRRLDGRPNLNHRSFPAVMDAYRNDAVRVAVSRPRTYLRGVTTASLIFLAPPMEHPAFRVKRRLISSWDRLYSTWLYGSSPGHWPGEFRYEARLMSAAEIARRTTWCFVVIGAFVIPLSLRRGLRAARTPAGGTILVSLFTLAFITVVAVAAELGENNRFRIMGEPLFWSLAISEVAHRFARFRSAAAPD